MHGTELETFALDCTIGGLKTTEKLSAEVNFFVDVNFLFNSLRFNYRFIIAKVLRLQVYQLGIESCCSDGPYKRLSLRPYGRIQLRPPP